MKTHIPEPKELDEILHKFADWVEKKPASDKVADNFDIEQAKAHINTMLNDRAIKELEGLRDEFGEDFGSADESDIWRMAIRDRLAELNALQSRKGKA